MSLLVGTGVNQIQNRIKSIRPKVLNIGNSVSARNSNGESAAYTWSAWGPLNWIYAFSGGAIQRCRTIPIIAGTAWATSTAYSLGALVQANGNQYICVVAGTSASSGGGPSATTPMITDGTVVWNYVSASWLSPPGSTGTNTSGQWDYLDAYGTYGAPGAQSDQMLLRLPQLFANCIETPDIIWLANMHENDLGQASSPTLTYIQDVFQKIIELCVQQFPNALLIASTPQPSDFYYGQNGSAGTLKYQQLRNWLLNYSHPNVVIEDNIALTYFAQAMTIDGTYTPSTIISSALAYVAANGATGTPNPFLYSDAFNTLGGGNVHQNEAGACIRARYFLQQLGHLFPNSIPAPSATKSAAGGNVYNSQVMAPLAVNPNLCINNTPGGTLSGVSGNIYSADYYIDSGLTGTGQRNTDSNGNYTGLQLNLTSSGSFSNAGGGPTTDLLPPSASNILPCYVQMFSRHKIISPAHMLRIGSGNGLGLSYVNVPELYYNALFTAGMSQVLQAGDILTFTSIPMPLSGSQTISSLQSKTYMTPQSGSGIVGPSVETQVLQVCSLYQNLPNDINSLTPYTSPVSLTTATAANITSITLPSGIWNLYAQIGYILTSATTSVIEASLSSTSATQNVGVPTMYLPLITTTVTSKVSLSVPSIVVSVPTNTYVTYYLVAQATFSAGTVTGYGNITATPYNQVIIPR